MNETEDLTLMGTLAELEFARTILHIELSSLEWEADNKKIKDKYLIEDKIDFVVQQGKIKDLNYFNDLEVNTISDDYEIVDKY